MKLKKIIQKYQKTTPITLLFIVSLIFIVTFGIFLISRKKIWINVEVKISSSEWWWIQNNTPHWLADKIAVGDKQYDFFGQNVGEILEVRSYEWMNYNSTDSFSSQKNVYLNLKLKVDINKKKNQIKFLQQSVQIGKPIDLNFGSVGFPGLVTYIENIPDNRVWEEKVVEAKLLQYIDVYPETSGISNWRAEAIEIGSQMIDSRGNVIAEILDKKVKPAEKITVTSDGKALLISDPLKKDVLITVKIKTIKEGGTNYYLEDQKVKVGEIIFILLPNINIAPEITKIIR